MAWKIEKWLAEVFPGEDKIYSEYRNLTPRELAIVSVAVLDLALAELITLRFKKHSIEIEKFLGLDGDGRAPVGSFGARIQLALLLDIITPDDAEILRALKAIRNIFSHSVRKDFLAPEVQKYSFKLLGLIRAHGIKIRGIANNESLETIEQSLSIVSEAGEGLLLAVFTIYQAYFHRMHAKILPINEGLDLA
ncbi:MAG: hypothetical protein ABJA10_05825 [Aestuariivirga sp.]